VVPRGADVECATGGVLGPDLRVSWTDPDTSVLSMTENRAHAREIQETAARHATLRDVIEERAAAYRDFDPVVRPRS
jgi:hypothetical protein